MINKNLIITVIIFLIFGLAIGFLFGTSRRPITSNVPANNCPIASQGIVADLLKLKMVQTWSAMVSGEVSKISGRTLSIVSNNESLEIPITDIANIKKSTTPTEEEIKNNTAKWSTEIKFEDIKVGDKVGVSVSMIDNKLQGNFVSIIP